ncbi:MAG: hypothetical protein AAFQ94_07085 [Bacteroidota bacterium]
MNKTCEKMLATMSMICQKLHQVAWTDDFEYQCWAYLTGDQNLPLYEDNQPDDTSLFIYFDFLKASAESISGWVNDVTYFEMDRWLILYQHWKSRNP